MEPGTWANWVSGMLTALALGFSFYQHVKATKRLEALESEEKRLEARRIISSERRHADAVTAWFEEPNIAAVHNAGEAVIYDVMAVMRNANHPEHNVEKPLPDLSSIVPLVPPGMTARFEIKTGWDSMGFRPAIEAVFRDASGIWWVRGHRGTLFELTNGHSERYGIVPPFPYTSCALSK